MGVQETILKAKALDEGQMLRPSQKVLSSNMVTGWAVNFPIYKTCQPSKVCVKTCYAGQNTPIAMKVALNKQVSLLNSVKDNPYAVGDKIIKEVSPLFNKGKMKFLRWNGVGDLFKESIDCLVHVAESLPDLPIWVVTRIPKWAAKVPGLPNLFVHFSLDAHSLDRYQKTLDLEPLCKQLFFSYTEDKGEVEQPKELDNIPLSVYFTDLYKSTPSQKFSRVSCPLNEMSDIKGGCERCGRCWSIDVLNIKKGETINKLETKRYQGLPLLEHL